MKTNCVERRTVTERGIAMVEFAISVLGLLTLVALIIDGSLLFQRQSLLIESAAELARRTSAQVAREPIPQDSNGCVELCGRAKELRDAFAASDHLAGFTFTPTVIASGSAELNSYAPYPLIRIDASAEARCLFCSLIPWELNLRAVSLLVIESFTARCEDGETHPCA